MSSHTETARQHGSETTQQHDSDGKQTDRTSTADGACVVDELSPSPKLVYKVLEYEGELTQGELVAESRLCARTVRYALRQLEEEGAITSRVNLEDARQSMYRIDDSA